MLPNHSTVLDRCLTMVWVNFRSTAPNWCSLYWHQKLATLQACKRAGAVHLYRSVVTVCIDSLYVCRYILAYAIKWVSVLVRTMWVFAQTVTYVYKTDKIKSTIKISTSQLKYVIIYNIIIRIVHQKCSLPSASPQKGHSTTVLASAVL